MNEEYHAYDLAIAFTFFVRHRVQLVGPGLAAWSYIRSPTRSQTSSVPAPKPSLAKSRSSKNRLSGWQELKAGTGAHTKNG